MRQAWGALYGRLATALGWTIPQIDDLYLSDVNDLTEYWRLSPPVHELVAAYLEYKPPEPERSPEEQQAELEDLVKSMNQR